MTSPAAGADSAPDRYDYAPIPRSALGPALNEQGYHVGRIERNLYCVTDGVYQAAFLTTADGVVLFDAPPSIGHNLQRAVDEIAAADGVSNQVTHFVYSHHHADHGGAASLFDGDVVRIGHEETRRLPGARLVKAFGTLSAPSLSAAVRQEPERAVLFYAADAAAAGDLVADLIRAGGYEPVRVGGLDQSIRIEMFGDLHEFGALGRTVTRTEALKAI